MTQGRTMFHPGIGAAVFLGVFAFTAVEAGAAADDKPLVVLDTSLGPITIELDKAKAPVTVENFLKYVDSGFYDGLIFHRVIPDFMVQAGGFTDQMREKTEGIRPPIQNEAKNGLANQRGTLAMARTRDPDSASAQFFINLADNSRNLGPGGVDPFGYAVFGRVVDGMKVVDEIAKIPTTQRGPHGDVPTRPVYIKSAKRKPRA